MSNWNSLCFEAKKEVQKYVNDYAVKKKTKLITLRSEKNRLWYQCKNKNCIFYLKFYCSKANEKWILSSFNEEHVNNCNYNGCYESNIPGNWLDKKIEKYIFDNKEIQSKVLLKKIETKFGIQVNYQTLNRARKRVLNQLNDPYLHLQLLEIYLSELSLKNPNSVCLLETNNTNFKRMFISLYSWNVQFQFSKRVVYLDGTFLTGPYGGVLLSAVGSDMNNLTFWLGIAIVSTENEDNWKWFIENLIAASPSISEWSFFMSDREKGIQNALNSLVSHAPHLFCYQHLKRNFKSRFNDKKLLPFLEKCAFALSEYEFESAIGDLHSINQEASAYLRNIPQNSYVKYQHNFRNYGIYTSNAVESSNATLRNLKDSSYLNILFDIISKSIEQSTTRYHFSFKKFTKYAIKILEDNFKHHCQFKCIQFDEFQCQVNVLNSNLTQQSFIVNLNECTCSCLNFQSFGIPCSHAIQFIIMLKLKPENFIDNKYTALNYKTGYASVIYPANFPEIASNNKIEPPPFAKRRGRPKKKRTLSKGEEPKSKKMKIFCSNCSGKGHNKRTCPKK